MGAVSVTSSLAIPRTQNTADVHEFRCMFTHDLKRKAKRWQDGFLTYHTFNKRIMVYDESRNRIGDAHWQKQHDFMEGDELRLQQGVLVEVQDQLGSKEQDVSGVIASKDSNRTTHAASSRPSPMKAITTIGPSGSGPRTTSVVPAMMQGRRPKTLSEILRTPRVAMGRARMPESPYDMRHGPSPDVHIGREPIIMCEVPGLAKQQATIPAEDRTRPRKRQRMLDNSGLPKTPAKTRPAEQTGRAKSRGLRNMAPVNPTHHTTEPILIESDDEASIEYTPDRPIPRPSTSSKTPEARRSKLSTASDTTKRHGESDSVEASQPARKKARMSPRAPPEMNSAAEQDRRSNVLRERPTNTLRLASGQPRRKITYRELLPSNFEPRRGRSIAASTNLEKQCSMVTTEANTSACQTETGRALDKSMPRDGTLTPQKADDLCAHETNVEHQRSADISGAIPSASQPDNNLQSTKSSVAAEPDTSLMDNEDGMVFDDLSPVHEAPSNIDEVEVEDTFCLDDAPTLADLAELDRALVASKRQQVAQAARGLSRARSNTVSEASEHRKGLSAVIASANARMVQGSPKRAPFHRIQTEPALDSPKAVHNRRSPLKKTISDQTGRKLEAPESVADDDLLDKKGPWSREAFDLFGWRPGDSKELVNLLDL